MQVTRISTSTPYQNRKQKDVAFGDFKFIVSEKARMQVATLIDEACEHEGASISKKSEFLPKFLNAFENLGKSFNGNVKRAFKAVCPLELVDSMKKPQDLISDFDDGEVILDSINLCNWNFGKTSTHSVATSNFHLGFVNSKGEPLFRFDRELVYSFKSKPKVTLDDLNDVFEQVGDSDEAQIDASHFVKNKFKNLENGNKNN